ncbi:MAG: hypothetical protein ACI8W1_003244, partial [Candidatus Azotimanducaceae bacterium]
DVVSANHNMTEHTCSPNKKCDYLSIESVVTNT